MKITPIGSDKKLEKLETLVHYVSHKCTDPTKLGATKLNKVLWYSDAYSFLQTGKCITGAKYVKQQYGPVPHDILAVRESLVIKGALAIRQDSHFGRPQIQFIALNKPNLSIFNAEEISLVDEVLDFICHNHTAASISELSHDVVWESAVIGEEIPVYAFLATRKGSITGEDINWATSEARRYGLVN